MGRLSCAAVACALGLLVAAAVAPIDAGRTGPELSKAARRRLATYLTLGGSTRQLQNEKTLNSVNTPLGSTCNQKMTQMNVSAFSFYRGSNELYYRDLANQSIITGSAFYGATASPWIQGDMHLQNAGTFDIDTGKVIYDLNDFDESFVANFLYDMYRMATSIVLVAWENNLSNSTATSCVRSFVNFYCDQVVKFYSGTASSSDVLTSANTYGRIDDLILGAEVSDTRKKMLDSWSYVVSGTRTFDLTNPDLAAVNATERSAITAAMAAYYTNTVTKAGLQGNGTYFAVQDIARRLNAGTGSLGKPRYYVMVEGATTDAADDRILDVKLQSKPSVYPYLTATQKAAVDGPLGGNDAARAVRAYKQLIYKADNHLGWMSFLGGNYSVRERSPFKESLDTSGVDLSSLTNLAEQWGVMLANAHCRSDGGSYGTPTSFETVARNLFAGQQDAFKAEVADFALRYASQVYTDFSLFRTSLSQNKLCV